MLVNVQFWQKGSSALCVELWAEFRLNIIILVVVVVVDVARGDLLSRINLFLLLNYTLNPVFFISFNQEDEKRRKRRNSNSKKRFISSKLDLNLTTLVYSFSWNLRRNSWVGTNCEHWWDALIRGGWEKTWIKFNHTLFGRVLAPVCVFGVHN